MIGSTYKTIDNWFVFQINRAKEDSKLTIYEKSAFIHNANIIRYGIRPEITKFDRYRLASARTTNGCNYVSVIDCAVGNVVKYAGWGAQVDKATGTKPYFTVTGVIVGVLVAIATCNCDETIPCAYPNYISTPDICYNSANGLDVYVVGMGSQTYSITWDLYLSLIHI